MKKLFAKFISLFIPFKYPRKIVRHTIRYGLVSYCLSLYMKNLFKEPKDDSFENILSVCAIAKNEGKYFKEWIEYHILLGVEKFYIYDNDSSDNTYDVLTPYIDKGIVEYIPFSGEKKQLVAYRDCVRRVLYKTKWLAVIDIDEFIVPVQENNIKNFLQTVPNNISQIFIRWICFSSNGHEKKPEGLVIENYTQRCPTSLFEFNKIIVKPHKVLYLISAHWFCTMGKRLHLGVNETHVSKHEKIRINHYHCKSKEEFQERYIKGDVLHGIENNRYTLNEFHRRDNSDVYDDVILKYVDKLKERLEKPS